jgi:riboflavin biosynthesis pyrimidine reductase
MSAESDRQAREVERLASEIYGQSQRDVTGVVHVCSAVRAEPARLHVIAINQHAPKSATDFFVLNFWRAHSDAIVTTAQVMRAEPQLSHELRGPLALGLAEYRERVLGKSEARFCVMLTASGDVPADHAMFEDRVSYVMLTVPEHAQSLQNKLGARAEIVGKTNLDIQKAITFAKERGARTIMIEAGPSTSSQLYRTPSAIDHLMLSRYEAPIDPAAVGGSLPPDECLFAGLTPVSSITRQEQSGPWRFQHFVHNR